MTQPSTTGRRFRTPPGWPPAPDGWSPPSGWTAPAHWPAPPEHWRFWEDADAAPVRPAPALPTTAADAAADVAPEPAREALRDVARDASPEVASDGVPHVAPTRRERRRELRALGAGPPPVVPRREFEPLEPLLDLDERALGRRGYLARLLREREEWHSRASDLHRRLHERETELAVLAADRAAEEHARARELEAEVAEWADALDIVRTEVETAGSELDTLQRDLAAARAELEALRATTLQSAAAQTATTAQTAD